MSGISKQELLRELRRHDWFHMYSDDYNVSHAGHINARKLGQHLRDHECPFEWWDIHKALLGYIVEDYVEVNPGEWRNPNWQYKCIASAKRDDLLTQAEADTILNWFNEEKQCPN